MSNTSIRSIVWDVGGVLIRTEDPIPRLALAKKFGMDRLALEALVFGSGAQVPGQLGQISFEDHWAEVARQLHLDTAEIRDFERQFFAGDVLDIQLVEVIRQLKSKYKTAVLSNAFSNLRHLLENEWQIADAFDYLVISAEVGMMKPDPRIFEHTLNVSGEPASATVFIDDSPVNIQAAHNCGIDAIRFTSHVQIMQELKKRLIVE